MELTADFQQPVLPREALVLFAQLYGDRNRLQSLLKDFLLLKTCFWDTESAIPENVGLLLCQWQGQEAERPRAAKGFKMALDECM